MIFVLRSGEEQILSMAFSHFQRCFVLGMRTRGAHRLRTSSACREACFPEWLLYHGGTHAEKFGSCCSWTRDGRAFDGCQLQLYISFPSGNAEAECQGLPAEEVVFDLPPSPSGDNEVKCSDLLSRRERARAGFVPWGMARFGRETQADRHWQRNTHHKITLNTKPCIMVWCCYL